MKFISTKNQSPSVQISTAIRNGIAPDGGLYVPESFPKFALENFNADASLSEFASQLFEPFFAGDPLFSSLSGICANAFNFEVPVVAVTDQLSVLELFHGPTGAFKDFGARFFSTCLEHMPEDQPHLTILVATSGDTGGAVGCAFATSKRASIRILFPKARVSPFQKLQLTCWGDNVRALEISGDFDTCQALVKSAFANQTLREKHNLGSANSINIARLLPQMSYYAHTAMAHFRAHNTLTNFIIPTGNMGNAMACLWARACGFPIGKIVFAINANRTLFDFFVKGKMTPRPSIPTIANAMDVGNPSNFERYSWLHPLEAKNTQCFMVSDQNIRKRIREDFDSFGQIWCPHTAVAAEAWRQLDDHERHQHWHLVATAHPFKFREIVEPLIDDAIQAPPALQEILGHKTEFISIAANIGELADNL